MRLVRKVVVARRVTKVYKARRDRPAKQVLRVTVVVWAAEVLQAHRVQAA